MIKRTGERACAAARRWVLMALCAAMSLAAHAPAAASAETFAVWLDDFKRRAIAQGFEADLLTRAFDFDGPLERVIELDRSQPEFVRPVWSYLESAVSASRIENGRVHLDEQDALFTAIEERWGVERPYLAAIWALESAYGAVIGDTDVVQALATLAWEGRRRDFFEGELFAVLEILAAGDARPEDLVGGWAGAMGQTQFMPTTYRAYAVDFDEDGRKNLWTDTGDALASAANYLDRRGWRTGEPWGVEVVLPEGFDFGLSDGRRVTVAQWRIDGVQRADGRAWNDVEAGLDARLLLPAGARGPPFLVHDKSEASLRYNTATSYARAAGLLGDQLAGREGLRADWPTDERPLTRSEVKTLQRALTALGHDTRGVDGRVGPNTRRALRAWQRGEGLPADAFPTGRVLDAVLKDAGMAG
ncbi:MAG: lytic murein transglycosylase [Caulobacterales bacterium]|nr:lytic murein transglycosylase [Caulobacterales bacterium]